MAMWPFCRMGSRRRSRPAPNNRPRSEADAGGHRGRTSSRTQTQPASVKSNAAHAGEGAKGPQRRGRTYSFSPGRQDSLRIGSLKEKPNVKGVESPSTNALLMEAPTLYHGNSKNKRSGQPLLRKKSSKRRKEDHDREAEIRAMSYAMPARAATDNWNASRSVKKDSRQLRVGSSGSAAQFSSKLPPNSLESIHSALSTDSEQLSWEVSAFDVLSPRPTLRFSANSLASSNPGSGLIRSQSARKMMAGPIPESTLRAHKRIHDLVDDLDASDLREVLERDQRRRQRKIEEDRAQAERRLARRAESQRVEEAAAARSGLPPPANLERGVLGREIPVSRGGGTSAVITSSRRRSSCDSTGKRSGPSSQVKEVEKGRKTPAPLNEFYRTDSIPRRDPPSLVKAAESTVPAKEPEYNTAGSSSPSLLSFMRSKKSGSNSPTQSEQPTHVTTQSQSQPSSSLKIDDAESIPRTPDHKSSRHWLSLFRWGKNQRASGPSSFSNTSRDSMSGNRPVPPVTTFSLRKTGSGVPKRTMSRFREDLPESPISPPDSRMASPEADSIPAEPLPSIPDDVVMRYDTPMDRQTDIVRASPISIHRDETQPSPSVQAMSLASVGSEASWLSGRISRMPVSSRMRTSLQHPRTVSALSGRSEAQSPELAVDETHIDGDDDEDEDGISAIRSQKHGLSSGEACISGDDYDGSSLRWGAVGQTPTVTQHRDTMRSREGVIHSFDDDKYSNKDNVSDDEDDHCSKGHFRNFSAGSAKPLESSPQASSERRKSAIEEGTE